jgi:hypothetical protein
LGLFGTDKLPAPRPPNMFIISSRAALLGVPAKMQELKTMETYWDRKITKK